MKSHLKLKLVATLGLMALSLGLVPDLLSAHAGAPVETADPDPEYDRLDGKGKSGKKVDVVEWEGNLEIHVYPQGSLAGLALKLDKKNKDKPVMVIGYRFKGDAKTQHVRRAVLGVAFHEGFKAYKDPSADGYDKIVISNNGLASPLVAYAIDPELKQLYPDGHPALASGAAEERKPASKRGGEGMSEASAEGAKDAEVPSLDPETGAIHPFMMYKEPGAGRGR